MERSHGILIRLTKLTETSLIVHWFTHSHGLIKTVAKGARRPSSPFAGKLDLFFGAEVLWSPSRTSELHALREVTILDWRASLRHSYPATLMASYFCRLLESAVEREHPDPDLLDLLRRGLDHLESHPPSHRALRHYEDETARLLGVAHDRRHPEAALRDTLGQLPAMRSQLLDLLGHPENSPSHPPPSCG